MTKNEVDFETWLDILVLNLHERTDIVFTDMECVRKDYDNGRDMFDVVDEIAAEYGE